MEEITDDNALTLMKDANNYIFRAVNGENW